MNPPYQSISLCVHCIQHDLMGGHTHTIYYPFLSLSPYHSFSNLHSSTHTHSLLLSLPPCLFYSLTLTHTHSQPSLALTHAHTHTYSYPCTHNPLSHLLTRNHMHFFSLLIVLRFRILFTYPTTILT
jgi:hypothetical protein